MGRLNVAAKCGGNGVETSGDRRSPLHTKKIYFPEITSKSVGANCVRPREIMKFSVIHGIYLANKYPQIRRDRRPRLSETHKEILFVLRLQSIFACRGDHRSSEVVMEIIAALCGGCSVATSAGDKPPPYSFVRITAAQIQ